MPLSNLPPGLWLHFDEEREVECERCKGTGILQEDWYQDGGDEYETMPRLGKKGDQCICNRRFPECGTGRRRVRVTGAVEVETMPNGKHMFLKHSFFRLDAIRDTAIEMFLAKELPGDVAKWITKEEL